MLEMIPDWLLILFVGLVAFPAVSFLMIAVFILIPVKIKNLFTRDE